jgi:hypothetical protein
VEPIYQTRVVDKYNHYGMKILLYFLIVDTLYRIIRHIFVGFDMPFLYALLGNSFFILISYSIILVTFVSLKAKGDYLYIRTGYKVHTIHTNNIIAVQPSLFPITKLNQWTKLNNAYSVNSNWRKMVVPRKGELIVLQTVGFKYLISVADAEEAARVLREAYHIPDVPIKYYTHGLD